MPQTNNNTTIVTTPNVVPDNSRVSPAVRTPPPTSLLGSLVSAHTGPMPVPRTSPSSNGSISHQIHARPTSSLLQSSASAGLLAAANTSLMSPAEASAPASNKILGRNVNGTLVMTSAPSNEAELQLYRVMQRASLLAYYDTLLEMGGDDVQQLCEAGEEEFLEIMALVGMASKPLHVRRLQKALQEWVSNPAMFQAPVLPGLPPPTSGVQTAGGSPVFPSSASSASSSSSLHEPPSAARGASGLASQQPPPLQPPPPISHSPAPPAVHQISLMSRPSPPTAAANGGSGTSSGSRHGSPSPGPCPPLQAGPGSSHGGSSGGAPSPGLPLHVHGADSMSPGSPPPLQLTPSLSEPQIARLAESARLLAAALPSLEPKPQNSKKRICKDLEVTHYVMSMGEDDPRRMEEIRKYAAIYGRFDCKRKPEKPLTLHEVSVNEAAAQICRLVPALLTRRDELFPLARQVVRDSGYQYSKAHSSESGHSLGCPSGYSRPHNGEDTGSVGSTVKRMRLLDPSDPHADLRRQERLEQISEELRAVAERQEELRRLSTNSAASSEAAWHTQLEALAVRQAQLAGEQAELGRSSARQSHNSSSRGFRRSARISAASFTDAEQRGADTDDTDSQFSYSNASSPSQDIGDSRDSTTREGDATTTANSNKSPNKVSKQLVQETLLGEGLRVVKELVASQAGEEPAEHPPPAHLNHAAAAAAARGLLHHYDAFFHHENKVQVISASGGNIIAVANPALSMSPAMLQGNDPEVKGQCSPRPHSAAATSHPITSLLQGLGAQFKQEPLSPCKSE